MSFLKKYACLYGDLEFTPEEEADLGRFAAELLKVASSGTQEDLVRLLRREFGGMDEETLDKVSNYLEFFSLYEKNAAIGKAIADLLAPISLALAATPLVAHGISTWRRSAALKDSLRKILQMHPELRSDPNVAMYFQAISNFAPDIAANPLVAGNLIMQMHKVGPSLVTPQLIRELVGIQTTKEMRPLAETMGGAAKPVIEAAKYYAKIPSK